jgi:hypothetical protein
MSETLLNSFMAGNGIRAAHLARECGYSRQYLCRVRTGRARPSDRMMAAVVAAVRRLTRLRITRADLFGAEEP